MKKSRIILAAGTAVLAIGSFIAGHASTKFAATKAYYIKSGVCTAIDDAVGTVTRFSNVGVSNQAQVRTSGGLTTLIYANSACNQAAYFKY